MLATILGGCSLEAGKPPCSQADMVREGLDDSQVLISHDTIRVPLGRVLLIRSPKGFGSIKFTSVLHRQDWPAWQGCATYESHFQVDGSGDLTKPNAVMYRGTASVFKTVGTDPFVWNEGNLKIKVGPYVFTYSHPMWISLYPYRESPASYGLEFAPTDWTEVRRLDQGEKLRWFSYNPTLRRTQNEAFDLREVR